MDNGCDSEYLKRHVEKLSHELALLQRSMADVHSASKKLLSLPSLTQDKTVLAQHGIEVLATLIRARYGAVGLLDDKGSLAHFLYTGLDEAQRERISSLPEGAGLLGAVIRENQVIRLDKISDDSRSVGFPDDHPPMETLLAAPISHGAKVYGRIYLSEKKDGHLFNETDEQLVTTFANTFGLVLHNAETISRQREAEHLAAKVIDNTLEGVVMTDKNFIIQSVNPAFCQTSGFADEELIGESLERLMTDERNSVSCEDISQALATEPHWLGELWCCRKNGEVYPKSATISAIGALDENEGRYVIVCRDISVQKKREEHLNHLAHHDALTGLPNRLLFEDRLAQKLVYAKRHKHPVALMFLDLDLFKMVNDSMGHEIGDELLQGIAHRLKSCVRESDTVARIGGDEFTIILDNTNVAEADSIAHKIRAAMLVPFELRSRHIYMTTSIGIGIYPQDGDDRHTLVKNADNAMYHAKEIGNAHCFYTGDTNVDTSDQLIVEDQLNKALENDELCLLYQPKQNIKSGRIVGAKVDLRWEHPTLGSVKPRTFVPLAEHTGLTIPIGKWMLRMACFQCKSWHGSGVCRDLKITIALSPRQFFSEEITHAVKAALQEFGLLPHYLELEISEIAFINDPHAAIKRINDLKELGVGIIVSDIGLEDVFCRVMEQCAADVLKLDGSFSAADIRTKGHLTEMMIAKAHQYQLGVVVDGVETQAQLDYLRTRNCDEAIGHYLSPPLVADEFEALLRDSI